LKAAKASELAVGLDFQLRMIHHRAMNSSCCFIFGSKLCAPVFALNWKPANVLLVDHDEMAGDSEQSLIELLHADP